MARLRGRVDGVVVPAAAAAAAARKVEKAKNKIDSCHDSMQRMLLLSVQYVDDGNEARGA
jgi:hypothetical protein